MGVYTLFPLNEPHIIAALNYYQVFAVGDIKKVYQKWYVEGTQSIEQWKEIRVNQVEAFKFKSATHWQVPGQKSLESNKKQGSLSSVFCCSFGQLFKFQGKKSTHFYVYPFFTIFCNF